MKLSTEPYIGQHCETTATGTLLGHIGIELSEPMLFGIGEGLGFVFWNTKAMEFPFIGGRIKTDLLTVNLARNLGVTLKVKETSSKTKAWSEVKKLLDDGTPVGLKLDCYHLEYFSHPIHFAGHYVAITGYDENNAYLVDTAQQGTEVTTSLRSLELARSQRGPMSSRNLYYFIARSGNVTPLEQAVITAIRSNAAEYLNPPIRNLGYLGIEKTAGEIIKWFDSSANAPEEFGASAVMMERAGTGGALFRNFYRDFLAEVYELTGSSDIHAAHQAFIGVAEAWSEVIALFEQVGVTGEREYVMRASAKLKELAAQEKQAMLLLAGV